MQYVPYFFFTSLPLKYRRRGFLFTNPDGGCLAIGDLPLKKGHFWPPALAVPGGGGALTNPHSPPGVESALAPGDPEHPPHFMGKKEGPSPFTHWARRRGGPGGQTESQPHTPVTWSCSGGGTAPSPLRNPAKRRPRGRGCRWTGQRPGGRRSGAWAGPTWRQSLVSGPRTFWSWGLPTRDPAASQPHQQ